MGLRPLIVWTLSMGLYVQAHAQTFNERYDLFNEGEYEFAWGVEVDATGNALVFFGGTYVQEGVQYGSALSTVSVSPEGAFGEGYRLHIPWHNSYVGWANCAAPRAEGGYIVGSSTSVAGDTSRAALFWLDQVGVVTSYREFDLPGQEWIGRQAKQTPDGGYVLCGNTSTVGVVDAFLLKTDAGGEVEWVRTYGAADRYDFFTTVDLAPWGGFYVGGTRQVAPDSYDPWILRMDEAGNVIGEGNYGTPQNDYQSAHLTTTGAGSVLMACALNMGASQSTQRACLLEMDENGEVTWQRLYGPQRNTALFVVQEVPPSNDLITCGFAYITGQARGILLRTTATGDSLWMREYDYHDDMVVSGQGAFYDVQATPDGGFIAVGVALAVPDQYTQDVWVVKTDSMGCIEPGCHIITGVETQITNLKDVLRVWPNPAHAGATVHVEVQLPENFNPEGALRLGVVSSDGRLVHEQRLTSLSSFTSLALPPSCSAGIYHLHLSDDTRWISGAKLVVH